MPSLWWTTAISIELWKPFVSLVISMNGTYFGKQQWLIFELSDVKKYPESQWKFFESESWSYKVMENCSRSWEELKRGCTLFKHARHAVPLWVVTMPWKVHEPCKNIFMSTFNPWAPKLSITNLVTEGYSHTLHIYFVGVVCCSHPYMNVILS